MLIWWAYRIGRPPSSDVHTLLTSFPQKPLGQSKSNFIWSFYGMRERKFAQTVLVIWPRWPPCPYMVKTLNQRTRGLVNAHLTPGPGIYYFNAFIHVYSPRAGQTTPWKQMLMSTESPYHCPFVQVLEQSLWSLILNDFIHVYSPRQGQTTPWGQNFNVNRNSLSLAHLLPG